MEAKRWYSITRDKAGVVSGMSDRTKYSWPDKKGSLVLAHDHGVLRTNWEVQENLLQGQLDAEAVR